MLPCMALDIPVSSTGPERRQAGPRGSESVFNKVRFLHRIPIGYSQRKVAVYSRYDVDRAKELRDPFVSLCCSAARQLASSLGRAAVVCAAQRTHFHIHASCIRRAIRHPPLPASQPNFRKWLNEGDADGIFHTSCAAYTPCRGASA